MKLLGMWAWVLMGLTMQGALLAGGWARFRRRQGRQVSWRLLGQLTTGMVVGSAGVWGGAAWMKLDMERHSIGLGMVLCGCAALVGIWGAYRTRRMIIVELGWALAGVLELAALGTLGFTEGLSEAAIRAWVVAPAALGLCGYFGVSVGYLAAGRAQRGKLWQGSYTAWIGRRYLLSKASSVLSQVTLISILGVALGVWLVLVALGILSGFEYDLQAKIMGVHAHVALQRADGLPFSLSASTFKKVTHTPGVVAVAPFIETEVAMASPTNYNAAVVFGIDPVQSPAVLEVLSQLHEGSLRPLQDEMQSETIQIPDADASDVRFPPPAPLASVVIGVEMAKSLNVQVGDRVRMMSPLLEVLTPMGVVPKSLGFQVAAIFDSKMYEYDARFVYISLPAARRFLELGASDISGLQVRSIDAHRSDQIGAAALDRMGSGSFQALDWKKRHQTLFSALKLERVVAFVVLVFIILVASFSIVSTLTMSVLEKRQDISILKTIGARDTSIMQVFLVQGLWIGVLGTCMGAASGVVTMKLLERFGFGIPGEVYYINALPVRLEWADVVVVVLASLLMVWDFSVWPALRGSQLMPTEGLREG